MVNTDLTLTRKAFFLISEMHETDSMLFDCLHISYLASDVVLTAIHSQPGISLGARDHISFSTIR